MENQNIEGGDSPGSDAEPDQSKALVVMPNREIDLVDRETRLQPGFFQRLIYLFRPQSGSVRENLKEALAAQSAADQTISVEERAMLNNILRLQGMRVDDVMVPRAEIEAVELKTSLGDVLELFHTSGHSRMPVFSETLDDPRGMVHIRDVVSHIYKTARKKPRRRKTAANDAKKNGAADNVTSIKALAAIDLSRVDLNKTIEELKLTRDVLFIPASMLASDLMGRMQTQRIQMALVIDEYGGTDGLVSLEDVVEIVVGDIEDEHDDVEVMVEDKGDGVYLVDARADLEEASGFLGQEFLDAAKKEDEDVDTVGGVIFSILGRVPVRGEVIPPFAGYELEVLEADPRRIKRVKISRSKHTHRRRLPRRDLPSEVQESA